VSEYRKTLALDECCHATWLLWYLQTFKDFLKLSIHDDTVTRQKCQHQCRLRLHGKQFFVSTLVYTFSVPVEVYLPSTRFSLGHFIAMNRRAAAAIVAICVSIKMRRRKKRSVWVKDWMKRRAPLGAYNQLLSELKNEDPECYKHFFGWNTTIFNIYVTRFHLRLRSKIRIWD